MEKYTRKGKLGEGGMGDVYLAHDNQLNRDVAVKVLRFDPDRVLDEAQRKDVVSRFVQEAQAAARLNHPGIVTIYEVSESEGENRIVMELLSGELLRDLLDEKRALTIEQVLKIGIQVCDALAYAHDAGIVHRDIKPENIFILDDMLVKIADFGVAQVDTGALVRTQADSFLGTPAYSSPEQLKDSSKVDGRTDIYSTGVMLYQLVSGRLPYRASNLGELINSVFNTTPAPVSEFVPDVPPQLEQIISRALAKDPADRYQNAHQMAEALRQVMPGIKSPVREPAPSTLTTESGRKLVAKPESDLGGIPLRESFTTVMSNISFTTQSWVSSIFEGWHSKEVGGEDLTRVLDRLLEVPMHTDPFSGALLVGKRYLLLIWNGVIVQAVDLETQALRDAAFDSIPHSEDEFVLLTPGEPHEASIPLVLGTMLDEQKPIHENLDSVIVDLSGLIDKLIAEKFTGAVRLRYESGQVYLGFASGSRILMLQSSTLQLNLTSTTVANLASKAKQLPFKIDVFETHLNPLRPSRRRLLKDATISVVRVPDAKLTHTTMIKTTARDHQPITRTELQQSFAFDLSVRVQRSFAVGSRTIRLEDLLRDDFGLCFTRWLFVDFFLNLLSSGNRDSMKYISTWIPEIETIKLNHTIEDAEGNKHFFDFVTLDRGGKILHLGSLGIDGSIDHLSAFIDSVVAVKTSLLKTGDIGGAFYVCPGAFPPESMSMYYKRTGERKSRFGLGRLDAFTGYKGFVRMSAKRGFHLALVTETEAGFRLVGPLL